MEQLEQPKPKVCRCGTPIDPRFPHFETCSKCAITDTLDACAGYYAEKRRKAYERLEQAGFVKKGEDDGD